MLRISSLLTFLLQCTYLCLFFIRLQEKHRADVEQLKDEGNELRNMLSQMEKELANVKAELEVQKEANNRAPTATLKNLVEQLKSQLAIKEKQQKVSQEKLIPMPHKFLMLFNAYKFYV